MPILNQQDATELEAKIADFFESPGARTLRGIFVELMDFRPDDGDVDLRAAPSSVKLPDNCERIAELRGVRVYYLKLADKRVNKREAAAAAKLIAEQLGEDMLLVCSNADVDGRVTQLHLIHPQFGTAQTPVLRRMVIERDLPNRTAVEQVSNIYWRLQESGDLPVTLNAAFDVEPVTKRFFQVYKDIYERALGMVTGLPDGEDRKQFVQTLFNRLMFVYFLSRKGWLTFDGDTDYLNALWNDYADHPTQDNFYRDRLTFLFFEGLNNPESRDVRGGVDFLIGKVPFLNGGLFEKGGLDERSERGEIIVPDDAIRPLMTELFDQFNFTVMESTPLDIEVAVDPEMLGKVFEELVTGRHDSGAYYTPRSVVQFMCREALVGYLGSQVQGVGEDALRKLVVDDDAGGIDPVLAPALGDAVDRVTVVDPACGSGAYLVGMMQELVELRYALFRLAKEPKKTYDLKLHIIERNLYGVDLDSFAVNIARLRLWLSLAIDFDSDDPDEDPPPLPNLDFKIRRGDSLIGPDPSQLSLDSHAIRESNLGALKAEHMHTRNDREKKRRRKEIEAIEDWLRESLGDALPEHVFDWRVKFAEVIAQGGFDIVLANPPYVVIKNDRLRAMYNSSVYGRMNTYGLFIHRSLQLMKDGGQLSFINPRTLLTDRYFAKLREFICSHSELRGVVLIADRHNTFQRVLQECIIFQAAKTIKPAEDYIVQTRAISRPNELNSDKNSFRVASHRVLLGSQYHNAFYIGPSELYYAVFEQMNRTGSGLASLGLKAETGKVQFDKYAEYALATPNEGACHLIWAENIQRYRTRASSKRVGREYLSKSIHAVIPPSITKMGLATQRVTANEQPRRIIATLVEPVAGSAGTYSENHTNYLPLDDRQLPIAEYILAVLNSSALEFIFRRLNSNTQVSAGELNALPFPPVPDRETLEEVRGLVRVLLRLGGVDAPRDLLQQIIRAEERLNELVGNLYGLSAVQIEEIKNILPSYSDIYNLTEAEIAAVEGRVSG